LVVVAVAAVGAPWLSPNPPDRRFPELLYRPADAVHIVARRAHRPVHLPHRLVSRLERRFEDDTEHPVVLRWLSRDGFVTADPDGGAPCCCWAPTRSDAISFSRLLQASRVTLALALVATLGATLLGALLGAVAGYAGGRIDGR
jgi:hypothetical protein